MLDLCCSQQMAMSPFCSVIQPECSLKVITESNNKSSANSYLSWSINKVSASKMHITTAMITTHMHN